MIKVIIFDLDGLLIDSIPLLYESFNRAFTKYGAPMSVDDWREWIANSYDTKDWVERNGLKIDPELVRAEKKVIYDHLIKNELKLKPGSKELVKLLSKKFRLALASATRMDTIKPILEKFELSSFFEKLLSDKEVKRKKPYPDVLLQLAKMMNVEPGECIVVEDSIAGLKAAKSAGMKCIICPDAFSNLPVKSFHNADKIVESLKEVSLETIDELDTRT